MPLDPGILLGAQGIRLPDPMAMAQTGLTLADLADRNAQRKIALQQQQDAMRAQAAMSRALPDLINSNWSDEAFQRAAAQNPDVGMQLLKLRDERRKAEADYANTQAQAEERAAGAKTKLLAPITNMAFTLSKKPDLSPTDIQQFSKIIADNNLQKLVPAVPFQDWNNPDAARKNLAVIGSAFFDAEKQVSTAETARHNVTTEGLTASQQAESARHNKAEEGIGYGNLGVAQGRLGLEKENAGKLQHVTMPDGSVYTFNPGTGVFAQGKDAVGNPITSEKPLSEVQGNATAFGMRMKASNDVLNKLESSGFDMGSLPNRYLPASKVGNYIADPKAQEAYQAKLNFMTASLRKESGAAISQSEFESEDKKYFPQPGDSASVREQKRQMRDLAMQAMSIQAGPGAKKIAATTLPAASQSFTSGVSGAARLVPNPDGSFDYIIR